MARVINSDPIKMKFTPENDEGGWLEWDEVVVRKGFRPKKVHRKIWKAYHRAEESK